VLLGASQADHRDVIGNLDPDAMGFHDRHSTRRRAEASLPAAPGPS
jgi:hypothetical protein